MNRVNQNDKAILDLKSRMRQIRTYQEKMTLEEQQVTERAKELARAGSKERALI